MTATSEIPAWRRSRFVRLQIAASYALTTIKRAFNTNKTSWVGLLLFLTVAFCAVFAPLVAPYDPLEQDLAASLEGPSGTYLLGTDYYGRDILSRLLYGAQVSLTIGFVAVAIAMVCGSIIGILAGYYGGRFDIVVMQVMDALLAIPTLIFGLLVVAMLGPSMTNLVFVIALSMVPSFARVARAPTIAVKEREYIQACRAMGFSDRRIMALHVLPNVFPEILVVSSLWLATVIRIESSLAFLGLGVKPPTATWGGMIRAGFENILDSPWPVIFPSLAILLVMFSLNLLGDGLRDAIDPKLKDE